QNQQASRYVDSINRRIGAVLVEMADEFSESWTTDSADEWLKDTESMSKELNSAWQTVRFARESERKNPRKLLLRRGKKMHEDVSYEEILTRVDEGISHLRNLTRTLREAAYTSGGWDERFRTGWVSVARDTGLAVADPDESVEPLYDRLRKLTSDMSEAENLPNIEWQTYGGLIASLRHIISIVDDVASAREARQTDRWDQALRLGQAHERLGWRYLKARPSQSLFVCRAEFGDVALTVGHRHDLGNKQVGFAFALEFEEFFFCAVIPPPSRE